MEGQWRLARDKKPEGRVRLTSVITLAALVSGCATQGIPDCTDIATRTVLHYKGDRDHAWELSRTACERTLSSMTRLTPRWSKEYFPTWKEDEITIRWHVISETERATMQRRMDPHGMMRGRLQGMASPNPGKTSCDIYVPEPFTADGYYVFALGHEVLHCFRGMFHGVPDRNATLKQVRSAVQKVTYGIGGAK